MHFELTEEQRMLSDTVYKWALNELGPVQEKIDEEDWMPPNFFRDLGRLGVLGITVEERYGGLGMDVLTEVLVTEQLARICPGPAMSMVAHVELCASNIQRNASDYLKEKYLPPLIRGEKVGAMGLTEPNAGSDAMALRCRAVRNGNSFILNGSKMFITNGPIADIVLVYAKTAPDLGPKGISAFIVEKGAPGFSVSSKIKKAGMRGSPTAELNFDDCEVPAENLVGDLNGGVAVMTKGLDVERVVVAGLSLGISRQTLDYSIKYSREREQFGVPICEFQMIQAKLAEMYARYEASRNMIYRAACLAQGAGRGGKGTQITQLAAAAILYAAEAATRNGSDAVQIHGGYGYCLEFPVQKLWRDAKLLEIGAGTTEIRKMIIARELLRKGSI
ncbi:MAG: acyl-CoA dehydrogenase family protein [Desulfomonilaceae bacterium]|nr:acyl-CoA dehydrogenase family protein [Desulfomonilaceae bacterium]